VRTRSVTSAHLVVVMTAVRHAAAGVVPVHDPLDRLVRGVADLRGTPLTSCLPVGGQYVHPFRRVLQ